MSAELEATLEARLTLGGLDLRTVDAHPTSTIVPAPGSVDSVGQRALDLLASSPRPREVQDSNQRWPRQGRTSLIMKDTLGEGGMGLVRAAEQCVLGREVAVKTLKPEAETGPATLRLLREAWITGSLEHPNVVPIYDIITGEGGSPQVVLKKIEGVDWSELIHEELGERFGAIDRLEWNLRTLLKVCDALRFAHSKKIIHRDLKPENVMIGAFGEVYLVDWGLALCLVDDGSGRFPLAADAQTIAGTPAYMAPEMLGGDGAVLNEQTDVYLLGAMLYEILSGGPPHRGDNFMQLVVTILDGPPTLPEELPAELVQITEQAMAVEAAERFRTVKDFKLAVERALSHRDALRLAGQARQSLEHLERLLGSPQRSDTSIAEAYALFRECRFGLRHALQIWPEAEGIAADLKRAILCIIELELEIGQPKAAQSLLAELDVPPPEWVERVESALKKQEVELAEMRRLQANLDPSRGRRTRWLTSVVLAGVWTVLPLVGAINLRLGGQLPSQSEGVFFTGCLLALVIGVAIWARKSLLSTLINRRIAFAAVFAFVLQFTVDLGAWSKGATVWETFDQQLPVWTMATAMLAASVDRRMMIPSIGYLFGYISTLIWPNEVMLIMTFCNLVLVGTVGLLWGRPREDFISAIEGIDKRRRALAELSQQIPSRFPRRHSNPEKKQDSRHEE